MSSIQLDSNMENILNNNDYKLIFLKAILLGISYGKSSNVNYYVQCIENEINNINSKKIKNITPDNFIEKHEKILSNLENIKNVTLFKINKFSNNHYASNYSKITFLQNNLNIINQEIVKNKLLIKKYKDKNNNKVNIKENISKNNSLNEYINERKKTDQPLVNELEKTLDNLSNLFI